MGKKDDWVIHRLKSKSWWNGKVTMLCGRTYAPGEYERLVFAWLASGKPCPGCHRR